MWEECETCQYSDRMTGWGNDIVCLYIVYNHCRKPTDEDTPAHCASYRPQKKRRWDNNLIFRKEKEE